MRGRHETAPSASKLCIMPMSAGRTWGWTNKEELRMGGVWYVEELGVLYFQVSLAGGL